MPLRLIHLTDIHFGSEDTAAVTAAAEFVRATPFDLLVATGDMTQWGRHEEFAAAKAWLASLPGPQIATPGNHDTPWFGLFERVTAPFERYRRAIGPTETTRLIPGLAVSTVNSARGWQVRWNWSKGAVSRPQIARAIRHLRPATPDRVRIVVCHHPLVEIPGEPITSRVRGGARAARTLASAGVDLVVSGHLHKPFVYALPFGDGLTYAIGAGTLSLRARGAPPGFNIIEIDGQRLSVVTMAWTGQRLEVERSWEVPLRPRPSVPGGAHAAL
jgi:3',5'-cyclic AMP phosphodiesterase CpdA